MVPRVSVAAGSGQQLRRFQTVIERNRIGAFNQRRQIAGESHAGHLRPVTVRIVGAPAGLDGVQIGRVECRVQERMSPVDARVEKTDARNLIRVGRELCPCQQLVEPFLLLFRPQGAKEIGGLLGSPKLRDAVERQHRVLHLFQ